MPAASRGGPVPMHVSEYKSMTARIQFGGTRVVMIYVCTYEGSTYLHTSCIPGACLIRQTPKWSTQRIQLSVIRAFKLALE